MRRAERGVVLVYAVTLVAIFAVVACALVNLMLGQATIVQKTLSGDALRYGAQGAQAKLNECLQDVTNLTCNAATLAACGFPVTIGDKQIAVKSASWTNSACVVDLDVQTIPPL